MISVEYFNLIFLFRIKLAEKGKSLTSRKLEEIYKSRTKQNSTVIPEQNCAIKVCHLSRESLLKCNNTTTQFLGNFVRTIFL